MAISVDPAPIDPIGPIPKELKLLLIEMLQNICLVAGRVDISDPTIRNSLDAFKVVLKNLETM